MAHLDEAIQNEIMRLCSAGFNSAKEQQYTTALETYRTAWELLPEPKLEWNVAVWIQGALGDAYFLMGQYGTAREHLELALRCVDADHIAFLHMRYGQTLFELGELDRAAEAMLKGYTIVGQNVFNGHDPKYGQFLQSRYDGIRVPSPKKSWQFWRR